MHVHLCSGQEYVSTQIEKFVKKCSTCANLAPPVREPLIFPNNPGKGVDLFEMNNQTCLLLIDYNSHYPEVIELNSTTYVLPQVSLGQYL